MARQVLLFISTLLLRFLSVQEYKEAWIGTSAGPAVYLNSAAQVPGNVGAGVQKGRGWAWPAVYLNSATQVPGHVGAGVQKGRGWAWPVVYLNSAAQVPGNVCARVQKGRGWAWPADQPGGAEPAVLPGAARVMAPLAPGQDAGSPLHTQEVSQISLKETVSHFFIYLLQKTPSLLYHT